jgi:transcriptional regulator GlxA family with amidase domain
MAATRGIEMVPSNPTHIGDKRDIPSVGSGRILTMRQTSAATLEKITGQDRFTLSRHFRRALGTSPDRYRNLRRVALAREVIEQGEPQADVAARTGFADQSPSDPTVQETFG